MAGRNKRFCRPTLPDLPSSGVSATSSASQFSITQLPEEDWKSVLLYCDVPTRCRLRRVSQYWKWLACSPDISEIVMVDRRCLMVAITCRRSSRATKPRNKRMKLGYLEEGWYYDYPDEDRSGERVPDRSHHKRHGILGPHVRVMIFNGAPLACYWNIRSSVIRDVIRSVGFFCSNLKQVVLWNAYFIGSFRKWAAESEYFEVNESFRFPTETPLTIRDSVSVVARAFLPTSVKRVDYCWVSKQVESWYSTAPKFRLRCRPLVYSPDELTWVVKFAAYLPESYREWAKGGIEMYISTVLSMRCCTQVTVWYVGQKKKEWCIDLEHIKAKDRIMICCGS